MHVKIGGGEEGTFAADICSNIPHVAVVCSAQRRWMPVEEEETLTMKAMATGNDDRLSDLIEQTRAMKT